MGKKNGAADDAAKVREGVDRRVYDLSLPVAIDDAAVAVKARELAKVIHERDAVNEERRGANAAFRDKVKFYDERMEELAQSVDAHTEQRIVTVVERLIVETSEIQVIRKDTGECVETRAASAEDRQEALDLDAREAGNAREAERAKKMRADEAKEARAVKRRRQAAPGEEITAPADLLASDAGVDAEPPKGKKKKLAEKVNETVAGAYGVT